MSPDRANDAWKANDSRRRNIARSANDTEGQMTCIAQMTRIMLRSIAATSVSAPAVIRTRNGQRPGFIHWIRSRVGC